MLRSIVTYVTKCERRKVSPFFHRSPVMSIACAKIDETRERLGKLDMKKKKKEKKKKKGVTCTML